MKFYRRIIISLIFTFSIFFIYIFYIRQEKKITDILPIVEHDIHKTFISKTMKCVLNYSMEMELNKDFQKIDNNQPLSNGYVYSAFYDDRQTKKSVVIISILTSNSRNFFCVVWFSVNSSRTIKANVIFIPEGSGRLYTAAIINCPLGHSEIPIFVSIIENECDLIRNMIKVELNPKLLNRDLSFSVCVTPFNLNYNKIDQLIEMVSINQLMGASQIYFYNYSTGRDVERVLDKLKKLKFVTVVPWHLPMKVHIWPLPIGYEEEVKYFGQMAMLNDCLYRNMGRYRYVAFSDLDEYLIPRQHRNWVELFSEIIDKKYADSKAWMFRNVFFKTEWPSDPEMEKNKTIFNLKAMSLLKVRREKTIYAPNLRSKMIVNPLAIDVIGVHNVWSFQPGASMGILSPGEGLCHHYRFWEGMGEKEFVVDRNIFHLREDLVRIFKKNRDILI